MCIRDRVQVAQRAELGFKEDGLALLLRVSQETAGVGEDVYKRQGEKTPGWNFEFGSTGLYSFGDGQFYVSHDSKCENGFDTHVKLYRWDGVAPLVEE